MASILLRIARAILPAPVRKPIADFVYRSIDSLRDARNGARRLVTAVPARPRAPDAPAVARSAGVASSAAAVWGARAIRVARRPRHVAQRVARAWLLQSMPLLWLRRPPTVFERGRLELLRGMLAALDRRFEGQFRSLLSSALPPGQRRRSGRPLVLAAIGTLGPGGAERQLVNTLVGLKAGYDVDIGVVAMYLDVEWQRFFLTTLEDAGITVTRVEREIEVDALTDTGHRAAARLERALRTYVPADLTHVAAYTKVFLERQPDVVHLWLDEVNIKAGLAAVLAGVPQIVLSMRSVNPTHFVFYQPYMKSGYRVLLERMQVRALNNSQTGADDYATWLGAAPTAITVVRNGVDFARIGSPEAGVGPGLAYRSAHAIPHEAFVMGGVMRLSEEKRPLLWLEAAALVAAACPNTHFLLVGDGVQRPQVDAAIAAADLSGRVHAPGHERKPYDSIAAMDVLFLSSIFEGLPNVLIEAQALGVPVVTTRAGGAVETVDDGRTGWVAQSGSAREVADIIIALVRDRALHARVGAAAPPFVHERFGMTRMLEETAAAYAGLPLRAQAPPRG